MAVTVTCTGVVTDEKTGAIYVNFADGNQLEFPDLATLKNAVADLDRNPQAARLMQIALWLAKDPDAMDPDQHLKGQALTLDLSAAEPIKVSRGGR